VIVTSVADHCEICFLVLIDIAIFKNVTTIEQESEEHQQQQWLKQQIRECRTTTSIRFFIEKLILKFEIKVKI
jgi:hypothetical protein